MSIFSFCPGLSSVYKYPFLCDPHGRLFEVNEVGFVLERQFHGSRGFRHISSDVNFIQGLWR